MEACIKPEVYDPHKEDESIIHSQDSDEVEPSGSEEEEHTEDEKEDTEKSDSGSDESLRDDLENVLSMNFDFKGSFALGTNEPTAPNPGLCIAPLGLIGLPLSERDAAGIKSVASQAPFGHGNQLVVDTNVRHTWEIEPKDTITFVNPSWNVFMESIVKKVCSELGVLQSTKPPTCELYKLLLYETGSHFLPHQDTEKAPGMFATIVVILPSLYSGGQVCVSHGSEGKVFDFQAHGFSTSVLAWYADVMHEVKPITSGYRLALSYNLIHNSTSLPLPTVPTVNPAIADLREIFNKWRRGYYEDAPSHISYLLEHQYSKVDLSRGEKGLKGADAHLVRIMLQIAKEEGVALGLAELECHIVGGAGEDFNAYSSGKRPRYGYYDEYDDCDDDIPCMGDEEHRTTTISSLVNLDGNFLIGEGKISVTDDELIPNDPFKDEDPDDRDYEGYMGNYPGDVQYWYHRTVLVLYLETNAHDLLLAAGGNSYAISQLKARDSGQPSPFDQKLAKYVAQHLQSSNMHRIAGNDREWGLYVCALALRWKDPDLWLEVASKCGAEKHLGLLGEENLNAAWDTFGFDVLRPLFDTAVNQCPTLRAQMEMLASLLPYARTEEDKARVSLWCDEQRTRILTHLKNPTVQDCPVFLDVLKSKGVQFFIDVIKPQLPQHRVTYDFLVTFVRELHKEKGTFSGDPASQAAFKQLVEFLLASAVATWRVAEITNHPYASYGANKTSGPGASFTRIKELCELCLLTEETTVCKKLFESLIKDTTEVGMKFKNYFIPLVPELRRMLTVRNIPLDTQPFGDFFRYLIETFLVSVLGAKSGTMRHNAIRKIGCGCAECRELDAFLFSTQAEKVFRYPQKQRTHLERQLYSARDIVDFRTIKSGLPHGLEVIKHDDIVQAASWAGRQKATKDFMKIFGGEAVVKLIMGARYPDIAKAISGEKAYSNVSKPFESSTHAAADSTPTAPSPIEKSSEVPLPSPMASASASSQPPNIVAGTKRKSLGFIDLSGSP